MPTWNLSVTAILGVSQFERILHKQIQDRTGSSFTHVFLMLWETTSCLWVKVSGQVWVRANVVCVRCYRWELWCETLWAGCNLEQINGWNTCEQTKFPNGCVSERLLGAHCPLCPVLRPGLSQYRCLASTTCSLGRETWSRHYSSYLALWVKSVCLCNIFFTETHLSCTTISGCPEFPPHNVCIMRRICQLKCQGTK